MFGVEVVPPQGFHFSDGRSVLTAPTKEAMIQAIRNHRLANGKEAGEPEKEYELYLAGLNQINPTASASVQKTLSERITNWASNRYIDADKIDYVTNDEAEERAKVCEGCKYNVPWRETSGCAPCVSETDRKLLILTQGKRTPNNARLAGCSFYGHSNVEAVFLPDRLLKHRNQQKKGPKVPCWLKDLDNGH